MHLGFGGFFKSLNGVYLNRQVLHKLEPEEVQDVMGHELGHYYKHYLLGDRFRAITTALGALLGIYVSQVVGMGNFISMIALSGVYDRILERVKLSKEQARTNNRISVRRPRRPGSRSRSIDQ